MLFQTFLTLLAWALPQWRQLQLLMAAISLLLVTLWTPFKCFVIKIFHELLNRFYPGSSPLSLLVGFLHEGRERRQRHWSGQLLTLIIIYIIAKSKLNHIQTQAVTLYLPFKWSLLRKGGRINDKLLRVDTMGDTARDDGNPSKKFGPSELFHRPQVLTFVSLSWFFSYFGNHQVKNTVLLLLLWPITALGYYGLALSMSSLGATFISTAHYLKVQYACNAVSHIEITFEARMLSCPTPWVPSLRSHHTSSSFFFLTLGAGDRL